MKKIKEDFKNCEFEKRTRIVDNKKHKEGDYLMSYLYSLAVLVIIEIIVSKTAWTFIAIGLFVLIAFLCANNETKKVEYWVRIK